MLPVLTRRREAFSQVQPPCIAVLTMTAGYTYDIDACVAEIERYRQAGADVVRVAVPERKDTDAL
jgi:(E)-4-hydroxy-3-methylbut-2-enyl-diphosphate synthase